MRNTIAEVEQHPPHIYLQVAVSTQGGNLLALSGLIRGLVLQADHRALIDVIVLKDVREAIEKLQAALVEYEAATAATEVAS